MSESEKATPQPAIAPVQSREEWLAIREAHHNVASRAYFRVWPQLDNAVIRRVFHIGHCKGYGATPQPINEPPFTQPVNAPDWVSLTDEDRNRAMCSMPDMLDGFLKTWGWLHFAKAIEAECRAKNGGTE